MPIRKAKTRQAVGSNNRVKLVPRYLNSSPQVDMSELARRIIDQSYSPEESASIKRLEDRMLGIMFKEKRAQ